MIEASLPTLPDDELRRHLGGCEAVVSCLGHVLTLQGLFGPGRTTMANAAHAMRELVTNPESWAAWRSRLPVIVDAAPSSAAAARPAPG